MKFVNMPEAMTDWSRVAATRMSGESGTANVRALQAGEVQLRIVEYGPGYLADHWCSKGHVIYVVSGSLTIEHQDGLKACELAAGMSWHAPDGVTPAHRVRCGRGATVFIVD